jgi:hypothetical protein
VTSNFCTTCGTQVLESIKVCPSCGNKSFALSANGNSVSQTLPTSSAVPPAPQTTTQAASGKSWSWDWLWQAIAITFIMKFFGPAGGLTAVLVYLWQEPKLGKWPAMGVSAVAGILVPLLILGLMKN